MICPVCRFGNFPGDDTCANCGADLWNVDERGYPVFTESPGRSALLARTTKGHEAVLRAISEGVMPKRWFASRDRYSIPSTESNLPT